MAFIEYKDTEALSTVDFERSADGRLFVTLRRWRDGLKTVLIDAEEFERRVMANLKAMPDAE